MKSFLGLVLMFFSAGVLFSGAVENNGGDSGEKEILSPGEKPYALVYKFPEGEEIFYDISFDRKDEFIIGGEKVERQSRIYLSVSQLFRGVDDKGDGIVTFYYLHGRQNGRRIFLEEKDADIKMSPDGRILESRGLQSVASEFLRIMQRELASYIPGFDRIPLRIDFSSMPSDVFNPMWQSFILPLPENEVSLGSTWKRRDRTAGEVEYTLKSVESGRAYIGIFSEGRDGTMRGEAVFDIDRGFVRSSEISVDTGVTARVVKGVAGYMGVSAEEDSLNLPESTGMSIKMNIVE